MAALSNADQQYLTKEQQAQITALKQQYAQAQQAGDKAAMEKAHADAEAIRAGAGYTAGASGSGYKKLGANQGGQTADQVRQWAEDYKAANWDPRRGWVNGYDVAMNTRSQANYIRQQMEANSKAWHTADKETQDYLHQQNVELAKILQDATGTSDKNHVYDPKTGKWYTWNMNVGYGQGLTQPNIVNSHKQYLGYTDEEIDRWLRDNDTSRYYNFVDTRTDRKGVDESSGFTGAYRQFANGPYAALLAGSHPSITNPSVYADVIGDGFGRDTISPYGNYEYDENGNVILREQPLKGNNGVSGYTNQFTDYVANGVIQPNILTAARSSGGNTYTGKTGNTVDASRYAGLGNKTDYKPNTADDWGYRDLQDEYLKQIGKLNSDGMPVGWGSNAPSASGGGLDGYLNQMYAWALESQLEGLKSSYEQNVSDLDASGKRTDAGYTEQKRQTTGDAAQQAAAWREMANAYGLNSGAIGQAGLAQNNQLQSNLNTLGAAQAAAQEEIERQRVLLGQQYQAAINEARANNNLELAQALYQEAVRKEEQLIQQQQYNSSLALQYAQLAMQQNQWQQEFNYQLSRDTARTAGSGSSGGGGSYGGGSIGSTGSGGGGAGTGYQALNALYEAAYNSPNPENYIATYYKDYGLEKSTGLSGGYKAWASGKNRVDELNNRFANTQLGMNYQDKVGAIEGYYRRGLITEGQMNAMLDNLGV